MKRDNLPLVPLWIRDPLIRFGRLPLIREAGRGYYQHAATYVAAQISRLIQPSAIYLKGSAAWNDVVPGLSDFDLAVVVADQPTAVLVSQVMKLRRYLEKVSRPWIPLGEVSWILEGEEAVFKESSFRLSAQHFHLKRFTVSAGWRADGWGERASALGLYEHALEKYLDGFRQLQFGVEKIYSRSFAHRQAAKFWSRTLAFLQAARTGEFPTRVSSISAGAGWETLGNLAADCLAELESVTPLVTLPEVDPVLPQTAVAGAYAAHLQERFGENEPREGKSCSLILHPSAPYFFESEQSAAGFLSSFLKFNFDDASEVAVKIQFPILMPRLSSYYRAKMLPRIANLPRLFDPEAALVRLEGAEAGAFAADFIYRSTEALLYRDADRLFSWEGALRRLAKSPAFSSALLSRALQKRAELFAGCAEALRYDRSRC